MGLEVIEQKLKDAHYFVRLVSDQVIVGKNPIIDEKTGIGVFEAFCHVYMQNGKFVVDYTKAQLPEEQEFRNEPEVIAFIKLKFPL